MIPSDPHNIDRPFRPCVGDIIMKAHAEGNLATCAVVSQVYDALDGDRMYVIQTNNALVVLRGPDRLTQHELDILGYHPATKEEWDEDYQRVLEWYESKRNELFEPIKTFVE